MARIIRSLGVSLAVLATAAPVASADVLPMRDSAFTPSQAAADQYLTPPVVSGTAGAAGRHGCSVPRRGRARIAAHRCPPVRGLEESGAPNELAGERAGGTPAAVAPAVVEQGATAPRSPSGTLPFTGGNLLALVWIALALLAAGCAAEAVRRRLEGGRTRARA